MAIARQESARNPKAQSPVGASGLMQVMPRTAQHTVQMFNIPGYVGPSQLFDPQTNITIGTSYLESVYQQFGRNRILSTAAYNAGPSRVNTGWATAQGGSIRWRSSKAFRSRKPAATSRTCWPMTRFTAI